MYNYRIQTLIKNVTIFSLMEDVEVLKQLILQKLVRGNIWGGKHIPLDFVTNGIPEHYRNTHHGKKAVEKAVKALIQDAWVLILIKKTGKGSSSHLSLNPRKVSEIKHYLENVPS